MKYACLVEVWKIRGVTDFFFGWSRYVANKKKEGKKKKEKKKEKRGEKEYSRGNFFFSNSNIYIHDILINGVTKNTPDSSKQR